MAVFFISAKTRRQTALLALQKIRQNVVLAPVPEAGAKTICHTAKKTANWRFCHAVAHLPKYVAHVFFRLCTIATWRYRQESPIFGEWRSPLAPRGARFGAKWRHLAPEMAPFGDSAHSPHFGAKWRHLFATWRHLANLMAPFGAIWRHLARTT